MTQKKNKNKIFRLSSVVESMLKKIAEEYEGNESLAIRKLIRKEYNNIGGIKKSVKKTDK